MMKTLIFPLAAILASVPAAQASFHLMQIEQVVSAFDGNTAEQAIQLRMRAAGQTEVSHTRIRAWDAEGKNPVLLADMNTNVSNGAAGSRILLATAAFTEQMKKTSPEFDPDFTLAAPIPASHLFAGRLTFESDEGAILWSMAWGSGAYTGPTTGETTNDADGDFGPPQNRSLPTIDRRSVRFDGEAGDLSVENSSDYVLVGTAPRLTNNAGDSYFMGTRQEIVVQQPPGTELIFGATKKNFGFTLQGTKGATKKFRIMNRGSGPLKNIKVVIDGAQPGDFRLLEAPSTTIEPGTHTNFRVRFEPSAIGRRKAVLHIKSNDANESPFNVELKGLGTGK